MMSAISSMALSQHQQYLSQSQNLRVKNSASEEANESPAERASEASGSKTNKLNIRG
jgi:hypothetical protein